MQSSFLMRCSLDLDPGEDTTFGGSQEHVSLLASLGLPSKDADFLFLCWSLFQLFPFCLFFFFSLLQR